ncbi:MAG: beta-ketoacyl-[acyl-carrier-protein] synthase family protein [Thermodesulfovibrionales bacterium]
MRRAAVTGLGVICSIGKNLEEYWASLEEGLCGIGPLSLFDTSGYRVKIAAQVKDESLDTESIGMMRRLTRSDVLGLRALEEALTRADLKWSDIPPERIAVVIGAGSGGLFSAEHFKRRQLLGASARPSLLFSFASAAFCDLVARRCSSRGARLTVSTACSSSSTALGVAGEWIRTGVADVVIAGGSESLTETTFAGFNSLRSVDEAPCRPFDRRRRGLTLGEGAAMFVVEDVGAARLRDAPVYAEILGYGTTGDAHHVTTPLENGRGLSFAIETALRDAGLTTSDIGYINAHGTGTPANDVAETAAIKRAFGAAAYGVPVSSTKSMIGHCLGAAGALEAAASILAIHRGIVPPTIHYEDPDPLCDLDYVPRPLVRRVEAVLSVSLAFGGNNTALILGRAG